MRFLLRRAFVLRRLSPLGIALLRIARFRVTLLRLTVLRLTLRQSDALFRGLRLSSLVRSVDGLLRRLRIGLRLSAVLFRLLSHERLRPRLRTVRISLGLAMRLLGHLFLQPVVRAGLRPRMWLRNARLWYGKLRDGKLWARLRFRDWYAVPDL